MKKIMWVITFTVAMVIGANATLITNGDWDSTLNGNWASNLSRDTQADLNGWFSSLKETGTNGAYVEPITGYGSGKVGALKAEPGNYFQQVLNGVDAGIGQITVNYNGGIRWYRSYPADARDLTLRVSLWNTTTDTELVGANTVTTYSTSATSLEARSHVLTYDSTGLAGDTLAIRFENITTITAGNANSNTVLFDDITVIPEPATLGMIATFGIGLVLVRRKKLIL